MDGRKAPRTAAMDTFRLGSGERRNENGNTTTTNAHRAVVKLRSDGTVRTCRLVLVVVIRIYY